MAGWFRKSRNTQEEPPSYKIESPIFSIGCGRSGTTPLFNIFKEHPQLAPTTGYPDGEDHEGWVKHGQCLMSGFGYPHINKGMTGHPYCLHMDENDVTDDIIKAMSSYYYNDVLSKDLSKRVVNKCPHLVNKVRYVREIFSDAKFVHIVRDCVPMVGSWIDIMVLGTFFSHDKIVEFKERSKVYKIVERFFNQTPFWTMIFAALTPVPFYPFRVIGIFSGYVRWKYVLSTFIGRTPRYYILAWLGNRYSIETRYIILLFFIMLIPPMIQIVRKRFPSGIV